MLPYNTKKHMTSDSCVGAGSSSLDRVLVAIPTGTAPAAAEVATVCAAVAAALVPLLLYLSLLHLSVLLSPLLSLLLLQRLLLLRPLPQLLLLLQMQLMLLLPMLSQCLLCSSSSCCCNCCHYHSKGHLLLNLQTANRPAWIIFHLTLPNGRERDHCPRHCLKDVLLSFAHGQIMLVPQLLLLRLRTSTASHHAPGGPPGPL
jgi:hypothetical protein